VPAADILGMLINIYGNKAEFVLEYQKMLGERVRRFRRELQLTQTELARLVGVTNGQISTIERGLSAPSIGTLHRISHAMGIPMIHFFDEPGQREVVVVKKVERPRLISPNSPEGPETPAGTGTGGGTF